MPIERVIIRMTKDYDTHEVVARLLAELNKLTTIREVVVYVNDSSAPVRPMNRP